MLHEQPGSLPARQSNDQPLRLQNIPVRPKPPTNLDYWDSVSAMMMPSPELRRHQDIYSLAKQLLIARMTGYMTNYGHEAQSRLWNDCVDAATIAVDNDIATRQLLKTQKEATATDVKNPDC